MSHSALALKVSGNPRVLTVVNTGAASALLVDVDPVMLPPGTTTLSTCSTLAPGATCTITIAPGTAPSAIPGLPVSAAVPMVIRGSNTNAPQADIYILDYGSFYQGGQVFALDDNTAPTASVGGKVAAAPTGLITPWNYDLGGVGAVVFVPGVTDTSVGVGPPPDCNAKFDGACNTDLIVAATRHVGVPLTYYAAGVCRSINLNSYADWYLPAICEMAGGGASGCPSGDTMQERLHAHTTFPQSWSSTQSSLIGNPTLFAWTHQFAPNPGTSSGFGTKSSALAASCVRQLTL